MLARRFTIICLLVGLFGMGFASLVAQAGRSASLYGPKLPCMLDAPCNRPLSR